MEDCKCEKKCFVVVPERVRNEIQRNYQQVMVTKKEKNLYLYGLIQITRKKSNRPNSRSSFAYFVRVDGLLTNICRQAFLNIHGISFATVRTLIGKLEAGVICPYDKREQTRNRISEETKSRVKDHIESLLNIESVRISSLFDIKSVRDDG